MTVNNFSNSPNHIAIIPDGNRRWARERGLPTFEGHRRGFGRVSQLLKTARDIGVHTVTLWAFSTENWNRSKNEIDYLMELYEKFIDENLEQSKREGVRIYHLGRKDRLPETLVNKIIKAEEETANNEQYVLNVALDYGGQDEILRATKKIIKAIEEKKTTLEKLRETEENRNHPYYGYRLFLDTGLQPYPYPDLIIRTSGEQRLSGLLPWQSAYAELYFEKCHFPDFTPEKLKTALEEYSRRNRRFGGDGKVNPKVSNPVIPSLSTTLEINSVEGS